MSKSDWRYIYGEINEKIHANGIKAISGELLNKVLTKMIEAVDGNLPKAGNGLNDIAGTFMRDLSIDGKYSSYYNANAGENNYTRVCLLRHHDFAKYNNIIIAVGFSRNIDRMSDLIFVNVGSATPTIKTLTTSNAFFLETTADGNAYLCLKKETNINTQFKCAFSILMASQNDGFDIKSGILGSFNFLTTEEATTGTIIASTCLTDDLADDSSVVHNTGAEIVSGIKTFSNGLINGSLLFGSPITPISLSGNATWTIDDLKTMMKVVLSGSTNTITLPNGGENPFRFQIIVAQDGTGSRALSFVMDDGNGGTTGIKNPSEVDFSFGSANQSCIATLLYDGNGSWWIEATNYVD